MWGARLGATLVSYRASAHIGAISVLCFHTLGRQEILVSGGAGGILRFWATELRELFSIEIDEPINDATWMEGERLAVGTARGVLVFQFNPSLRYTIQESLH